MASYVGSLINITDRDATYQGIIHSLDLNNKRVTLYKAKIKKNGHQLKGLLHFGGNDIISIEVIKSASPKKEVQQDDHGPTVMRRKLAPAHIKNLKDIKRHDLLLKDKHQRSRQSKDMSDSSSDGGEPIINSHAPNNNRNGRNSRESRFSKYMTEKQPDDIIKTTKGSSSRTAPEAVAKETDTYAMIDTVDDLFRRAMDHIKKYRRIGLAAEGVNIGRDCKLCWILVAVPDFVFLFDVLKLGRDLFTSGLAEILENGQVEKVIHDCRFMSDMFHHQYQIKLTNVFDTQVADVMVYKLLHGGDLPRYVGSLHTLLFEHLELSEDQVFIARKRDAFSETDMAVWAERPVSVVIVDAAVKTACYLLRLREVLYQKMLMDFDHGVSIYLNIAREAQGAEYEDRKKQTHLLPEYFENLRSCKEEKRRRYSRMYQDKRDYDQRGFRENCPGHMDPLVKFSHDSCWHQGTGIRRTNSPEPATTLNRARSASQTRRSKSRDSSRDNRTVMEIGSEEVRKQMQSSGTNVKHTELTATQPDVEALIKMPFDDAFPGAQPRIDNHYNGDKRPGEEPKYQLIAAGYESAGARPSKSQIQALERSGGIDRNVSLGSSQPPSVEGGSSDEFMAIPNSNPAAVFSQNVNNRLPRCAVQDTPADSQCLRDSPDKSDSGRSSGNSLELTSAFHPFKGNGGSSEHFKDEEGMSGSGHVGSGVGGRGDEGRSKAVAGGKVNGYTSPLQQQVSLREAISGMGGVNAAVKNGGPPILGRGRSHNLQLQMKNLDLKGGRTVGRQPVSSERPGSASGQFEDCDVPSPPPARIGRGRAEILQHFATIMG